MWRLLRILIPALLLVFIAALLAKLLLTPVWSRPQELMERHYPLPPVYWERGWPIAFQQDDEFYDPTLPGGKVRNWNQTRVQTFSGGWLAFDIGLSLCILVAVGYWSYRRVLRPGGRSFSLRFMMIGVAIVAVCCGWWLREDRRWKDEQETINKLSAAGVPFSAQVNYCGSDWLQRLCMPLVWTPRQKPPLIAIVSGPVLGTAGAKAQPAQIFSGGTLRLNDTSETDLKIFDRMTSVTALVQNVPVNESHLQQFTDSLPQLRSLREVRFAPRVVQITSRVLEPIGGCTALEVLDLAGTDVDDAGIAAIAPCSGLQVLDLSMAANVDDEAIDSLLKLRSLEILLLRGTQVTDAGIERLMQLPHLERMSLPSRISDQVMKRVSAKGIEVE